MDGYHGGANEDGYLNDASGYDGDETRDFLSQAPAYAGSGGPTGFRNDSGDVFGYGVGSNGPSLSHLGFSDLDLNATQSWPDLARYQEILQSPAEDGGSGSAQGPPPVRVPSRAGRGSLGLRPPRRRVPPLGPHGDEAGGSAGGSRRAGVRRSLVQPAAADEEVPPTNVPNTLSRAQWSPQNTRTFCQLYVDEIDKGNCPRGQMSKWGWKNLTEGYFKATELVHDNIIFGSRVRQLKKEWNDLRKLYHKETGLGRNADGSISASAEWWRTNDKDNKLKGPLPDYMDLLERMFLGVAVTGETAYAPSRRNAPVHVSSDDDEAVHTPQSTGSKRSYSSLSTRSTAASPSKRGRSPAVRMNDGIHNLTVSLDNRTEALKEIWHERNQAVEKKKNDKMDTIDQVIQLAKEAGATEDNERQWIGVLMLTQNEAAMRMFIKSEAKGRMAIIKHYAGGAAQTAAPVSAEDDDDDDDEQWEEDFFSLFFDDIEEETAIVYGMSQYAMHIQKYYNRADYRVPKMTGLDWVEQKLANTTACYHMFRMTPDMFYRLHKVLTEEYGLRDTKKSTSIEALGMFLWMVGAPQSYRQADDRFERSLGTVHNMFYGVLACLVALGDDIIKPVDPEFSIMHPRVRNRRFYPEFKRCIGAIDGSHFPVLVPQDKFVQHLCRKGITTQNVMAACDFDMIFTFLLAGWPGSAHDTRVFEDAMTTFKDDFPHPPQGMFYLVDAGYPNRPGYLAPYKGTKYHIQDFQNAGEPRGKQEIFNYAHSSLRNVIERAFGVLKMKWRILLSIPAYPPETQTQIIVACVALHNFIRLSRQFDVDFQHLDHHVNFVPAEAYLQQPETEPAPDSADRDQMNAFRDSIANRLFHRY